MSIEADPLPITHSAQRKLALIGQRIRDVRKGRGMTLQSLADASGLSPSMLSLVERGLASPSIGSLIVLSDALGLTMSEMLETESPFGEMVVRGGDVSPVRTASDVMRKVMMEDRPNGLSIAVNEYAPQTASNDSALTHEGYEYGLLIDGSLTVEVDGKAYIVNEGDLVSYSSRRPHRIYNHDTRVARTVWINTDRR